MNGQDTIYKMVTDRIMEALDKGTVPWHKPWKGGEANAPFNLSGNYYRGINTFILAYTAHVNGWDSPVWLTFKQANKQGGKVRKGEKSTVVVFWKWIDMNCQACKDNGSPCGSPACTEGKRRVPFLRYYRVFNLQQTEGVKLPKKVQDRLAMADKVAKENGRIQKCEDMVDFFKKNGGCSIDELGGGRAFYVPAKDEIHTPELNQFDGSEEYYSTTFHEMIHATGHQKRLNRESLVDATFFGDPNYSKEELVAEFGAAFLCGVAGIENKTVNNSAAYIASWKKKLAADPKLVVQAAAQAQKAADWVIGKRYEDSK